jgi:hypothetical protein
MVFDLDMPTSREMGTERQEPQVALDDLRRRYEAAAPPSVFNSAPTVAWIVLSVSGASMWIV